MNHTMSTFSAWSRCNLFVLLQLLIVYARLTQSFSSIASIFSHTYAVRSPSSSLQNSMLDIDISFTSIPIFERESYDDKIAVILFNCDQGQNDSDDDKTNNQKYFQEFIQRYRTLSDANLLFFAEEEKEIPQKEDLHHPQQRNNPHTMVNDRYTNIKDALNHDTKVNQARELSNSSFLSRLSSIVYSSPTKKKQRNQNRPFIDFSSPFMTQDTDGAINILHDKLTELRIFATNPLKSSKQKKNVGHYNQNPSRVQIFPPFLNLQNLLMRPKDQKLNRRKSRINLLNNIRSTSTFLQATQSDKNKSTFLETINVVENRCETTTLLEAYRNCIQQGATHILIHPCRRLQKSAAPFDQSIGSSSQTEFCLPYDLEDLVDEASSIFPGAQWKITEVLDPVEQVEPKWQSKAIDLVENEFPDMDTLDKIL